MLRNFIILGILVFLTQCGRHEPLLEGIDFPPAVKASVGTTQQVKVQSSVSAQDSKMVIVNGVKILNTPLVFLKGKTEQFQTEMTLEPGS